jgi:benzoyl-CoA reductase/2-hydroxyglutaryl-CoA dehydratase subunit BcrC/BadD/HgdB
LSKIIGITTTVPSEILLAADYTPVDLNNIFITDSDPESLIELAEHDGFPQNCCAWIKGIYGVVIRHKIDTVLGVTTGDCSNTLMLMEVLKLKGVKTIPFAYPEEPKTNLMGNSLRELAKKVGARLEDAEEVRKELATTRSFLRELDELTWRENKASSLENHLWLVSSSDFNKNPQKYKRELKETIDEIESREPYPKNMLRLAYLGVPPIFAEDFYRYLEKNKARVVFNEIQRQFAMPCSGNSLAEQYCNYTYPYSIYKRLEDILPELIRRRVDGVIHYVQAFCHRGIGDIIFRHSISLPILTLEGNDELFLNQHLRTRIEAFLDMLWRRKRGKS